jgi:hypothetical protein
MMCDRRECVPVVSCGDECFPGERACGLTALSWYDCDDYDGDGCAERSDEHYCSDNQVCVGGACVDECDPERPCNPGEDCIDGVCIGCTDDCDVEGFFCSDDAQSWFQCGYLDTDPCLDRFDDRCGDGEYCEGGACRPLCTYMCHPWNPPWCDSELSFATCITDEDGCTSIQSEPCPDGQICEDGACECPATCTVGEVLCDGPDAVTECAVPPGLVCPEWVARECPDTMPFCEGGECRFRVDFTEGHVLEIFDRGTSVCDWWFEDALIADASMGDVDGDGSLEAVALANGTDVASGEPYSVIYAFDSMCSGLTIVHETETHRLNVLLLTDITDDGVVDIVVGVGDPEAVARGSGIISFTWNAEAADFEPGAVEGRTAGPGINYLEVVPPDVIRGTTGEHGTGTELCIRFDGTVLESCP